MIETPLRFFEVNEEFFLMDSEKFCNTKLRITSKGFDAANMIFASREFIFMMANTTNCAFDFRFRKYFFDRILKLTGRGIMDFECWIAILLRALRLRCDEFG